MPAKNVTNLNFPKGKRGCVCCSTTYHIYQFASEETTCLSCKNQCGKHKNCQLGRLW